jgi:hypothetical protein
MSPRKSQINYKYRHLNQKGENHTNIKQTQTEELFPHNKNIDPKEL